MASRLLPGEFGDIRCFDSREIPGALQRLVRDREAQRSIGRLLAGRLRVPWLGDTGLVRWLLRTAARLHFRNTSTVNEFCGRCYAPVNRVLKMSIRDLSASGLENLRAGGQLLISNHRDIVLDALISNHFMYRTKGMAARVAIGTNLESLPPWVVHLMRMIGCFFVPRGETAQKRERYKKLMELSTYIRELLAKGDNVWIAQREGRALDGVDQTEPAVLKMLTLHSRRKPLSETMGGTEVVPVSVSYEWDPCDLHKAKRVALDERTSYTEEVQDGVVGEKGRVHIHFGQAIATQGLQDADGMSAELDRSIRAGYRVWPSSYAAREMLGLGEANGACDGAEVRRAKQRLQDRVQGQGEGVRKALLRAYAAPLAHGQLPPSGIPVS